MSEARLQVTALISESTGHLPGVTIAVMGCIVNGPGTSLLLLFGTAAQKDAAISRRARI